MIPTIDDQPIIALCTPQGGGAIALLRISGLGAIELTDKISRLSSKKNLCDAASHTIHHGYVLGPNNKTIIDEVLFFLMRAPQTFTGQDTVEISCHNNQFIINQIINQAITHGAHHAQRGEFTKRAFLNKKIDLLQAEAINDLISAQTEHSLKKSMSQLRGTLSNHLKKIEIDLFKLLSLVEASFEFLDEEQQDINLDFTIKKNLKELIAKTGLILANFAQQQHIKRGVRIAIIGNSNAGKSTLFNALVKQERAIVTPTPGTTRDAIETTLYKNGIFWLLIDTAGLRETQDYIEQKGIDRSWQEAAQSDIILLIVDATTQLKHTEQKLYQKIITMYPGKVISIINKIDISPKRLFTKINGNNELNAILISAKNSTGLTQLEEQITKKIQTLFSSSQAPFLLNQRQHDLILELHTKLKTLQEQHKETIHYEIIAYHLTQLIEIIGQLTGKNINEQVIDTVFNSFCVGK